MLSGVQSQVAVKLYGDDLDILGQLREPRLEFGQWDRQGAGNVPGIEFICGSDIDNYKICIPRIILYQIISVGRGNRRYI